MTKGKAVESGEGTNRTLGGRRRRLGGILPVAAAALLLGGCGLTTGSAAASRTSVPQATPRLRQALRDWSRFPVDSSPRRLVLTGPEILDPAGGFPDGADKLAYIERDIVPPATLPAAPATSGGYPVIGAREALRVFSAAKGSGPPASKRLRISSVSLGTGVFRTDRGTEHLPAWLLRFRGVHSPAAVLAVAPSRIFAPGSVPAGRQPFITAAWMGPKDRTLTADFTGEPAGTGPCTADYRLQVETSKTAVAVVVLESSHASKGKACSGVGYARHATVKLSAPLGARVVVDATTDAAVTVTRAAPHS